MIGRMECNLIFNFHVTWEKQTLRLREISMQALVAFFEICFRSQFSLASKKKIIRVKLQQQLEIFCSTLFKRDACRPYREWNKLKIQSPIFTQKVTLLESAYKPCFSLVILNKLNFSTKDTNQCCFDCFHFILHV